MFAFWPLSSLTFGMQLWLYVTGQATEHPREKQCSAPWDEITGNKIAAPGLYYSWGSVCTPAHRMLGPVWIPQNVSAMSCDVQAHVSKKSHFCHLLFRTLWVSAPSVPAARVTPATPQQRESRSVSCCSPHHTHFLCAANYGGASVNVWEIESKSVYFDTEKLESHTYKGSSKISWNTLWMYYE